MSYLITQILLLLVLATLLGLGIGWIVRAIGASRREKRLSDEINRTSEQIPPLKEALFAADSATRNQQETISALRSKLDERDSALNDAEITQREIEQQRDSIENQVGLVNAELKKAWATADSNEPVSYTHLTLPTKA